MMKTREIALPGVMVDLGAIKRAAYAAEDALRNVTVTTSPRATLDIIRHHAKTSSPRVVLALVARVEALARTLGETLDRLRTVPGAVDEPGYQEAERVFASDIVIHEDTRVVP